MFNIMGYIMDLRKLVGSRPIITTGASVLLCKEGCLLLQLRTDNGLWALPGGSMEPGEKLEEVAKRELFEETGLIAINIEFFEMFSGPELYYKYPHGDEVYNVISTYICSEFEGHLNADESEVQELRFFKFDNIPNELSPPDKIVVNNFLERIDILFK